jgi:multidrug efflux pump subunit AcrB
MWLIKASLRNPYLVATIVFMILVLGMLALWNIPVDILPVFRAPAVEVLTYYPGMPASAIEKTITNRIERWVNQCPGVRKIESKSVPGVSVVKLYFRDDIDPNAALTLTNSLALGTLPTLPPNTLPPVVLRFDPTGTIPLGILTVTNPHLDEAHLKDYARINVRNDLGAVPGCVAPVVIGGKDRTVLIYVKPDALQVRGLSLLDVVNALKKGNMMVTPGTAYIGKDQLLLDTNAMVDKVKELNDLPIRIQPGANVYLKDVGYAADSSAIQTSRVRINDRQQVYVPIYRQQGASSLAVANGVKNHIKEMEAHLPPDTKLTLVMDQTESVKEAIVSLIHEGIIGAALVSVMILIFLGNWRMTLIASISIPLAILGSIIGLYTTGNTINAMTLGGLALAIGPLVDDAIVALENNQRHLTLGKSLVRAAFDGCVEVMVPVLVATFTTSIVLAPIALMPGMGGFLFRPLALAVTFAMFTSFFLSRTFVPMMCAKFLRAEHKSSPSGATAGHHSDEHEHPLPYPLAQGSGEEGRVRGGFGRVHHRIEMFLNRQTKNYEWLLATALRHRIFVLTMVGLLFVGALALTTRIGQDFFPQVDCGQITMFVRSPSKLRLDAAEQRMIQVEKFLEDKIPAKERRMIVTELGLDPDWSAAYTANSGQQDAVIRVQLTDERRYTAQEYAVKLRHWFHEDPRFADLSVNFDTGGMVSTALNYGTSSPIDIQIDGGTLHQAMDMAKEIRKRVTGVRGAADVHVAQRLDAPYLIFNVNRQKAASLGLNTEDVILQVVAAMNSSVSINHNFWIDNETGNQYFVGIQYPENPNAKLEDILNIVATGAHQQYPVYLRDLVTPVRRSDAVEINHVALYRTFDVLVNTENRDLAGVAKDIQARLRDLPNPDPERIHWQLRGEYQRMTNSFKNLIWGLILASVLVYLLQVALFRSWLGPFIIMFTVPLGLIGVLTMLFLTRTTLNVQSEMGVIFLVGIAVNNGVLLLEFANRQRRLGASIYQAITTAAAIRFRPIIMTFLATFLDLVPMAIGIGKGSEANVPLARAVVGGLLTSTCLTLFVVPIMYTLLLREGGPTEADIEAELADEALPGPSPKLALPSPVIQVEMDGQGPIVHPEKAL